MIAGLHGSLLSHDALAQSLIHDAAGEGKASAARAGIRRWLTEASAQMGPSSSARAVFDRVAAPLAAALGFRVTLSGASPGGSIRAVLEAHGTPAVALVVTPWGRDPGSAWRDAVLHGIGASLAWTLCINGPSARIIDARRTYSRRFAQFDLLEASGDPQAFLALWTLLGAHAFEPDGPPMLERAVALSESHRAEVRTSLQQGVHEAIGHLLPAFDAACRPARSPVPASTAPLDESLTVIYRILFLLFAEARGLVPQWHPTYRNAYTIEALRPAVEIHARPRGLWESLQAIARLAHQGCEAGSLRVPAFNGRLFSPTHAPLSESRALDDGAVRQALLALTTRPGRERRVRISYADLGVEQLGGVYERILDFDAATGPGGRPVLVPGGRRKATGSFYTPRSLTDAVVRRTLGPLVEHAAPERILALRILDPAMGSGAFLVAACRYLAAAYEASLVREGVVTHDDVTDAERADFRRVVAQRCLYGVDNNPMAVQLGRLSLWLATLSGGRPLTFLDHHLRTGNSLVGASLADVARVPPPCRGARRKAAPLPLFASDGAEAAIGSAVGPRLALATGAGETLEQVRAKERLLASIEADAVMAGWKAVADLWCAAWFSRPFQDAGLFRALVDHVSPGAAESALPTHVAAPLLAEARNTAARERFFHWALEFPEVFHAPSGDALEAPGFDAVIGNPPWEMLRADHGGATESLTSFTRTAGIYALQSDGHANLYQLFLERSLSLVRPGGRLGLLLPSGVGTDHGCSRLRRHLLERTRIDTFVSIENRDGLFPIHRALRFVLLCASAGGDTGSLPLRTGVRSPHELDRLPDTGPDPAALPLPRALLERASGASLSIPEIRTTHDLSLFSRIVCAFPALGDPEGWQVRFGRELNATDDKCHFIDASRPRVGARAAAGREPARRGALPVVEGKQIQPFTVDVEASRFLLPAEVAGRILDPERTWRRRRLAYRDVASATNRLTLIAAMIPCGAVTTHTLFCARGADDDVQAFLCGIFNSYVANYLVRMRVSTHVSASIIDRIPVPRPPRGSPAFVRIAALSASLGADPTDHEAQARLQASVARLYRLDPDDFEHVLRSFPLIDAQARERSAKALREEAQGDGI